MADKIIAPIAMVLFVIFVGFLAFYIGEVGLWIVIGLVAGLALFDFSHSLRSLQNGSSS